MLKSRSAFFLFLFLFLITIFTTSADIVKIVYQENGEVFLQKDLSFLLQTVIDNINPDNFQDSDYYYWHKYLNSPHPSVDTINKYFESASKEFGVPAELLKVIGQVENNWTQIGPSIDQGWGIMHLVDNPYCNTLADAALLLDLPVQVLKDEAKHNIRGAAALLSKYADNNQIDRSIIENWFEPAKTFSGLISEILRTEQALRYFKVMQSGIVSNTNWQEKIIIEPYYRKIMLDWERDYTKEKSPDYPDAIWNSSTQSPNYSSRYGVAIDTWVNHWIGVGTYAGAISWFQHPDNNNSSAHFVIRASDGEISQCVLVQYSAWHCGASGYPDNNRRSIGVEHESTAANPDLWYSVPMLEASTDMARYFADLYSIPKVRALPGIRGHNEMPGTSTSCPGNLPWDTWMDLLINGSGAVNYPFVVSVKETSTGYLNVRSGPGTSYDIITQVYPGEKYVSEYYEDGWYRVHMPSGAGSSYGWSLGGTATDNGYFEGSQETAFVEVVHWKGTLNVRTGPGTDNPIITTITSGQRFAVLDESSGWYKIQLANVDGYNFGWSSGSYLNFTAGGNRYGFGAEMTYIEYPETMESGSTANIKINVKNTGSNSFNSSTVLATTNPRFRSSQFYHSSWISASRVMGAVKKCLPGQVTQYSFTVEAPLTEENVFLTEYFNLYQDGYDWFSDQEGPGDSDINFSITVIGSPSYPPPLNLRAEIINENSVRLDWDLPGSKAMSDINYDLSGGDQIKIEGRVFCKIDENGISKAEIIDEFENRVLGYTDIYGHFIVYARNRNTIGLKIKKGQYMDMTRKIYTDSQKKEFQSIGMVLSKPDSFQMSKIKRKYPLESNTHLEEMHKAKITELPATRRVLMPDNTVVVMELDEYLRGVLPKEVYTSWNQQALRAQAMAARCYAAITSKHNDVGADVCTTTCCQAWGPDHYASTDQAVEATSGHSLKHSGHIIESLFFAHSNGYTKNNEDVWGGSPIPYLRSVPSPCGYDYYYGHGVGMAQWGSKNMADSGYNWEQIVCHYYTGISIDYPASTTAGYKVYRNSQLIATINDPDTLYYIDYDLSPGEYTYAVTAIYDQEESAPSNAVTVFIEDTVLYTLSLYADPPDAGIVLTGAGDYPEGTLVNIEALTDSYIFVQWTGSHTGLLHNVYSADTFFYMPSYNVEFTAVFEEVDPIDGTPAVLSLEHSSIKGIWQWNYSSSKPHSIDSKGSNWVRILENAVASKLMAGDISGDGNLEIIANIPEMGLWYYNLVNHQWHNITGTSPACNEFTLARTTAGGTQQIIASFENTGLYRWAFNGSWTSIMSVQADTLSASDIDSDPDAIDELMVAFKGYEGFYIYDFATSSFTRILMVSPSQIKAGDITGDGYSEMVCVFDGYGIYLVRYIPSKNEDMRTHAGKLEGFDLINDIPENSEWAYKSRDGKGFQFSRITWGTPDPGHHVATGDIASHNGAEVIFTYQGRTYYYSHDTKGWSTLIEAPAKRIISGRFTGGAKDDLIICETLSGSLYLRKSSTDIWELLAANGNSNAMTALE